MAFDPRRHGEETDSERKTQYKTRWHNAHDDADSSLRLALSQPTSACTLISAPLSPNPGPHGPQTETRKTQPKKTNGTQLMPMPPNYGNAVNSIHPPLILRLPRLGFKRSFDGLGLHRGKEVTWVQGVLGIFLENIRNTWELHRGIGMEELGLLWTVSRASSGVCADCVSFRKMSQSP